MTEKEKLELEKEAEIKNGAIDENPRENVDCPFCKNKETIFYVDYEKGEVFGRYCSCVKERNIKTYLRTSGLSFVANAYTFDNFIADTPWQKYIKDTALEYIKEDYNTTGFYIGGQVGAGKSHVCSAIAIYLIKKGNRCKYVRWRDFTSEARACMNSEDYKDFMKEHTSVKLLYVDDFLNTPSIPTDSDLKLAYDLINGRYANGLNTIISSEYVLPKIHDFYEALHSRIVEHTEQKYCLSIPKDIGKDQRLK